MEFGLIRPLFETLRCIWVELPSDLLLVWPPPPLRLSRPSFTVWRTWAWLRMLSASRMPHVLGAQTNLDTLKRERYLVLLLAVTLHREVYACGRPVDAHQVNLWLWESRWQLCWKKSWAVRWEERGAGWVGGRCPHWSSLACRTFPVDFPPLLSLCRPFNAGSADSCDCCLCRKAHLQPDFLFADDLLSSLLEASAKHHTPTFCSWLQVFCFFFFLTVTPAAITNLTL